MRERRLRQSTVIDNQTGIQQINSSLYNKISNRVNVTRTDQVCAYPRRTYRRHTRHNPYALILPTDQKSTKTDINDNNNTLVNPNELKSSENIINELKTEMPSVINDDQVVILNEHITLNKTIKRRTITNYSCSNCKQKFKTKNQINSHLVKCQSDLEIK